MTDSCNIYRGGECFSSVFHFAHKLLGQNKVSVIYRDHESSRLRAAQAEWRISAEGVRRHKLKQLIFVVIKVGKTFPG